ncbi:hypothetical protein [Roseovarius amoyensis]|uniref:hypothetical protein n=1 Tax=Roseovarius amoyensis TaxID=2211448 RepID=UPI0019551694|nr:hypothetical protein [Roseovarius amoyensis]
MPDDPLDPVRLLDLDLPPERLRELALMFAEIRAEIAKMRAIDLGETHPAVVYAPEPKPEPEP